MARQELETCTTGKNLYEHTIDPLNRIEGDLAINISINEKNVIENAQCLGFVYRGFENIFINKQPFDAMRMSTRSCGVCPISHGTAGAQAIEDTIKCTIPRNAEITRDLLLGANWVVSHATHFYFMWGPDLIHDRYKSKKLYPEIKKRFDPLKSPHLIKLLKEARIPLHKIVAKYGGRFPHPSHAVPGGVTYFPKSVDLFETISLLRGVKKVVEDEVLNGIPAEELLKVKSVQDVLKLTNDQQFAASDLGAFIAYAQDIGIHKYGEGHPGNFLSFGFGKLSDGKWLYKPGYVENGKYFELNPDYITEDTSHSYYATETEWRKPAEGITKPIPRKEGAYSWIKSPRYFGHVVEVGPLARQVVNGNPLVLDLAKAFGVNTFTRTLARLYETVAVLAQLFTWTEELDVTKPFQTEFEYPKNGQGMGLAEAPRGSIGHWISIKNSLVERYQIITPTTWNCSPVDSKGQHGSVEQALIGVKLADKNSIIEAGQIVRSFDPCISCSIHAVGKQQNTIFIEASR